ncbi:DUF695 domain-containing protein [Desulfovibrio sp. OttesenSCG-928-G15]|nr:DUF695 domain-containing protein [Desulfovibrio sp. OttesenSCG-928-G15]
MEGNWDTYLCRVDDKPAQILLDLDLIGRAPLKEYPVLGYISISMQDPDEDGFPKQEEFELFSGVEEFLVDVLTAKDSAVYAGSCTTDGRFDMFFYMRFVGGWANILENAMRDYEQLEWETGLQEDPDWTSYRAFLYPDDQAMLEIQNRRVLEQLSEIGDDLSSPRMIDHFAGFPTRELALAFAEAVEEEGFILSGADAGKVTYFAPPATNGQETETDTHDTPDTPAAQQERDGPGAAGQSTAGQSTTREATPDGVTENTQETVAALSDTREDESRKDEFQEDASLADESLTDESLTDEYLADEPVDPQSAFRVQFSRRDAPEDIDYVSFPLAELATSLQGSYLGWATPMIR